MKSIDRFEGDIAIIDDDGKLYGMRRDMLPSDAAEGDIIAADIMNSASGRTAISMAAIAADTGPFLNEYTAYTAEYISAAANAITYAAIF